MFSQPANRSFSSMRPLFLCLILVSSLHAAEVTHIDVRQVREYIPHNILEPGEVLNGRVSLRDLTGTHQITVRWMDAYDRCAGAVEVEASPPASGVDFALPLIDPMSFHNRIEVLVDGQVAPRSADFQIRPVRREWSDYHAVLWSDHEFETFELLRDAGIDGQIVYKDFPYFEEGVAAGFESYVDNMNWRVFAPYHKWRPKWNAVRGMLERDPYNMFIKVRSPSFEDPATDTALETTTRSIVKAHKARRPLFYNLADEIGIGDQSAPIDFDHSYFARNAFISYLRNRYETLQALNKQWKSGFDSFYAAARSQQLLTDATMDRCWKMELPKVFASIEEAEDTFGLGMESIDGYVDLFALLKSTPPRTREEIRGLLPALKERFPGSDWDPDELAVFADRFHGWTREHEVTDIKGWNLSPWMDHKDFMDRSLADALARARGFGQAADPDGLFGFTGGHGPGAMSGYNLYYLSRSVDVQIPYNISSDIEILRSIKKDTILMSPTWHADEKGIRKLWYRFFHGDRGVLFWDNDEPGNTFVDKDTMALTARARNFAPDLKELTGGLGRQLIAAERRHDRIAVLYSQASLRAQWMIQHLNLGREWRRDSWVEFADLEFGRLYPSITKLLEDNLLQYDFIYSDQVVAGGLDSGDYQVLILPQAIALSDAEIAAIRRFVSRGGSVVADHRAALMDDSGRVRDHGGLDDVFGLESAMVFTGGLNPVTPGAAVQDSADGVLRHSFGSGKAFYLNASLLGYYEGRTIPGRGEFLRDRVRKILELCGVEPYARILDSDGNIPLGVEVVRYRNGGQTFLALFRNPRTYESGVGGAVSIDNRRFEQPLPVHVTLPTDLHVFDLRAGTPVGRVRQFDAIIDPWRPRIFTLAESPPGELTVTPSRSLLSIGESVAFHLQLDRRTEPADTTVHVVNRRVFGPDGAVRTEYGRNQGFTGTAAVQDLRFALNDPLGDYRVVFTSIPTGTTVTVPITVR